MSELQYTLVIVVRGWFIYSEGVTVGYEIKKVGVGQPCFWLAAEDCVVFLSASIRVSVCACAALVYINVCSCLGLFGCEAHFNMIIIPAIVCVEGYEVMGALLHSQVSGDRWVSGQCAVSVWVGAGVWRCRGGQVLFDDLRTVAPRFGLPLGERQPGGLCGHLWGVGGREALWHLLDSRGRRCGVCNLHGDRAR